MATASHITIYAARAHHSVALARMLYDRSARDLATATTPAEAHRAATMRRVSGAVA